MQARTKKRHTEETIELRFIGPIVNMARAIETLKPFGGCGTALIQDWLKEGDIELSDSIVKEQLRKMNADNTDNFGEFYAFHALRFCVGGFVKWPRAEPVYIDRKIEAAKKRMMNI